MKQEDLDKAAEQFCANLEGKKAWSEGPDHYDLDDVTSAFLAGANWQKEQMWNTIRNFRERAKMNLQQSIIDGEQRVADFWDGAQDMTLAIERGLKEDEK